MELALIEDENAASWDDGISSHGAAYFYHGSGWIRFLQETQKALPLRFRIVEQGKAVGYLAGLLVRKGPLTILGSPLSGWFTEYMGPIPDSGFDISAFLPAVDRWCRRHGVHQIEMGSPLLAEEAMRQAGYDVLAWKTFRVRLSADETRMWSALEGKARNRIRKALSYGLRVEDCGDSAFAGEHFDMLLDVYAKQNRLPPQSADYFRSLLRNLAPYGQLFCLRVKQGERTVASGFFPHDRRRVYSLSTASRREDQHLCPNDLLHWTVMTLAGRMDLEEYRLGDNYRIPEHGGHFKDKFNGEATPVLRFVKNYSLLAKYGRGAYKRLINARQSLRDALRR
jgi:hypothetical protein